MGLGDAGDSFVVERGVQNNVVVCPYSAFMTLPKLIGMDGEI
jgi:hypothetical protein